jgi:hypothetical protein
MGVLSGHAEDERDIRFARAALAEVERDGTVPWEEVKARQDGSQDHQPTRRRMGAAKKLELTPDEIFIQDALRDGRAIRTDVSMKALGKPDATLQARVEHLNDIHLGRLKRSMENQDSLAPVVVFKDKDDRLYLADGFHRHHIYSKAGKAFIPAYQIDGDYRDALEFATMCNRENCLGRTKEDEKKAVKMLLANEVWSLKADGIIAKHVGLSRDTVSRVRLEYCKANDLPVPDSFVDSNGKHRSRSNRYGRHAPPRIAKNSNNGFYYHNWRGKSTYLGRDPESEFARSKIEETERKVLEISDWKESFGRQVCLGSSALRVHILSMGLIGTPLSSGSDGIGTCFDIQGHAVVFARMVKPDESREPIGRALIAQKKIGAGARAIIVCYDPPACEVIDIAKQLGIEFMTPEELVESFKG